MDKKSLRKKLQDLTLTHVDYAASLSQKENGGGTVSKSAHHAAIAAIYQSILDELNK